MRTHTLLVITGIVIAGAVAYTTYRHFYKTKNEDRKKGSAPNGGINNAPDAPISEKVHTSPTTDVYETREAVAHSVRERHSAAAKAMEESLNTIFNDSKNDDIVTENSQILTETSSDLDDLLK